MAKKTYEDFYKENRKTKPIVSGSFANRYQYNKAYYEYLAHLEDLTTNYNKKLNPKDLYNFPTLSNPEKVTKADIIAAQEAVFELQKKKAEIELQNEWRRNERERKKNEYLEEKAKQEELKKEKEWENQYSDYVSDFTDIPVDDTKEMIANLRDILNSGLHTSPCNFLINLLDQTIQQDYDTLISRLYGVEDYALDLAHTVAFDSNFNNVYDAGVKLAELITGSQSYNQQIYDSILEDFSTKSSSNMHNISDWNDDY